MELLHSGWPVHEAQLRAKVGDAQVDDWLRDGTLYYGEAPPFRATLVDTPARAAFGSVTPDPSLTTTPGKKDRA